MKKKIETSLTVISLLASIVGIICIGIGAWKYIDERYEVAVRFLVKLFGGGFT